MAKNTAVEMARDGVFCKGYAGSNFLSVREALNIDRIIFEGVPIGQKGQNGATVYLPVDDMLALCRDIKSGAAKKKIDADTGAYPSAYKYVMGENGSRVLTIGGGKIGCRVSIQNKATSKSQTVPLQYRVLEEMADHFLLWTGRVPVMEGSYYGNQIAVFNEGMAKRANERPNVSDADLADPVTAQDESETPPAPVAETKPEPPKPAPAPKAEPTAKPAPSKTDAGGEIDEYHLIVFGEKKSIKDSSGAPCWVFDAKLKGEPVKLLFTEQKANELGWFADFEKNAKKSNNFEAIIKAERRGKFFKVIE